MILIIVALIILLLFFLFTKWKRLKLDAVVMINGGVKCGKTTLAVALAIKKYKQNLFKYKVRKFLFKVFRIKKNIEEPKLYSNIPLKVPYCPLTAEIISRRVRVPYKSVMLFSEMSLIIDSMSYEDDLINEQVTLFIKLFGHETRGGSAFIETQALADNHYAIRRCIGRYFWIHSLIKVIPFVLIFRVREMAYSENAGIQNNFNEDVEDTTKLVIISKKVWKKFDTYCYSSFTDNLDVVTNEVKKVDSLKVQKIVSFRQYRTLPQDSYLIPIKEKKKKGEKEKCD